LHILCQKPKIGCEATNFYAFLRAFFVFFAKKNGFFAFFVGKSGFFVDFFLWFKNFVVPLHSDFSLSTT